MVKNYLFLLLNGEELFVSSLNWRRNIFFFVYIGEEFTFSSFNMAKNFFFFINKGEDFCNSHFRGEFNSLKVKMNIKNYINFTITIFFLTYHGHNLVHIYEYFWIINQKLVLVEPLIVILHVVLELLNYHLLVNIYL